MVFSVPTLVFVRVMFVLFVLTFFPLTLGSTAWRCLRWVLSKRFRAHQRASNNAGAQKHQRQQPNASFHCQFSRPSVI